MKKEDLIAMGLTEEQAKKVMDSLDGNFVTKARFNEVNEENKTLKQSVADISTLFRQLPLLQPFLKEVSQRCPLNLIGVWTVKFLK